MPAILKRRRRFRVMGDFTVRDRADGLPRSFRTGDPLPPELADQLSRGEVDALQSSGRLVDLDAPPAPKPVPEPAQPLTAVEILRNAGWSAATVVDRKVENGPRGYSFRVLERAAREGELERVAGVGRETPVLVSVVDGVPVATLPLAKLAPLLVTTFGMR